MWHSIWNDTFVWTAGRRTVVFSAVASQTAIVQNSLECHPPLWARSLARSSTVCQGSAWHVTLTKPTEFAQRSRLLLRAIYCSTCRLRWLWWIHRRAPRKSRDTPSTIRFDHESIFRSRRPPVPAMVQTRAMVVRPNALVSPVVQYESHSLHLQAAKKPASTKTRSSST